MQTSHKRKKAFTLTELLVVVIVIGVLSAVVLPKFSKVVETRKTTEAEELMSAVRTEQEKRCVLDKNYLTDFKAIGDIAASKNSKNYAYSLTSTGMEAQSKGKYGYTLKMPSYADGRICCENEAECAKLNKDYPLCSALIARADYRSGAECAGESEEKQCTGSSTQACGCNNGGTQTRTCDTSTGTWSGWSACSVSDACECTGTKPEESQTCNNCGTQTRSVTCDTATGQWKTGNWNTCSKTEAECAIVPTCFNGATRGRQTCNICGTQTTEKCVDGTWITEAGECSKTVAQCLSLCSEGATRQIEEQYDCGTRKITQECKNGKWETKFFGAKTLKEGAECWTGDARDWGGYTCTGPTQCLQTKTSRQDLLVDPRINDGLGSGSSTSDQTCNSGQTCKNCKWEKRPCGSSGSSGGGGGGGGGGGCTSYRQTFANFDADSAYTWCNVSVTDCGGGDVTYGNVSCI